MAPYKNLVSYLGLSDEELAKPYEADSDFQPMTPRQILTYGVKECKKFGDTYDKKDLLKYGHYKRIKVYIKPSNLQCI